MEVTHNHNEGTSIIGQVVENLSAHGIPNIKRAKTTYRRFFWLLAFIGGLTAFTIHCYESFAQYLDYDVIVNLDIRYDPVIAFPAVTICNLNPVKESALAEFSDLNNLFGPPPGSSSEGGGGGMMPPQMTTAAATTSESGRLQDWDGLDYQTRDTMHTLIDTTTDLIGSMNYTERMKTGHLFDDMLLSCTFKGFPCGPQNFTWFYNYQYGNCYTFNSGSGNNPEIQTINVPGPLYGLTVSIYIQQDEYIPDIQQGAGLRIKVHPQNEMPFPEDEGLNVPPGTEAFVSLRKKIIKRIDDPYTNCSYHTVNDTVFSEYFPQVEYSKLMCEKNCYYQEVVKKCSCADVRYRYDDDIPACDSMDRNQSKCTAMVEWRYQMGQLICPCTLACEEDDFTPTISYSAWPNEKYKPVVESNIMDISDTFKRKVENSSTFIETNVVKLNVYFEELIYDYIYQTEAYGPYDLLSDIGGNVGLWVGISALTVVEFAELIYDIVVMLCFNKGRKTQDGTEKTTTDLHKTTDVHMGHTSLDTPPNLPFRPAYTMAPHSGLSHRHNPFSDYNGQSVGRNHIPDYGQSVGRNHIPDYGQSVGRNRIVYNPGYDGNFIFT